MGSFGKLAKRALKTEMPVMVQMQELLRVRGGVVHWQPPNKALEKVKRLVYEPSISRYGNDEGIRRLRAALDKKLRDENNLHKSSVMVTAGANQTTGITNILVGHCNPETLHPDADWLERILSETKPTPKLVTVVNPGNPTGTYIPESLLKRISDLCENTGSWLVVDNTYEYFMYDGLKHSCVEGNHIVNVFSFSKAHGMMGWRVGYIAYPTEVEGFAAQLLKVQDNIPICASILSQYLALYSLEMGPQWVLDRVQSLVKNRDIVLEALSPLGEGSVKGGEGAIYLWAKLPEGNAHDDFKVVRWLAKRHRVRVIPGSACGGAGNLRISFGGLTEDDCREAAKRLKKGLSELVRDGLLLLSKKEMDCCSKK